jgi:alanine dehydrogenase
MRVGTPREIKSAEHRVGLTPTGVGLLAGDGHDVLVEAGAGTNAGFTDQAYKDAGARLTNAETVWTQSELLVKVKEPLPAEYSLLQPGQTLLTYLHLAPNPRLTEALLTSGVTAIAYEMVTDQDHRLPLLMPMSEIAGRLAAQAGAYFLQDPLGGRGVLMGGAAGVAPARVLVLGGGVVGTHAAKVAVGMGADVTILEVATGRLGGLHDLFHTSAHVLMSDGDSLRHELAGADLVIGAVLRPGERAPQLLTRELLNSMCERAVIVDVAIDQGGCAETSRVTTHDAPVFVDCGILHYCVANMPGAVPVTATRALTNATLPYVRELAALGVAAAIGSNPGLASGVNVRDGEIVSSPVADAYADSTSVV